MGYAEQQAVRSKYFTSKATLKTNKVADAKALNDKQKGERVELAKTHKSQDEAIVTKYNTDLEALDDAMKAEVLAAK